MSVAQSERVKAVGRPVVTLRDIKEHVRELQGLVARSERYAKLASDCHWAMHDDWAGFNSSPVEQQLMGVAMACDDRALVAERNAIEIATKGMRIPA